jgi:hypothetical protein
MRRAAEGTPGQGGDGGAQRRFAGASPGRGSLWPKQVLHVAGKLARMPRRLGREHKPPRRPAPKGGGSASPASSRSRRCAQEKGKEAGGFCSPRKGASKMLTVEDGAVAAMFSDGGESGGAPATRGAAPGARKAQ